MEVIRVDPSNGTIRLDCVVCIREHVTGGGPSAMAVCSAHRLSSNRLIVKRENVNNKNDMGSFVTMELSMKREAFCQILVTESCNPTEAYRKAYNVTSDRKATHTEAASRLMKDSNVSARIEALKLDISDKLASEIVFDKRRIISELALNMELGRENGGRQLAASNQAINLIGKAINVFEPETIAVSGTVSVIHSLSDAVLDQLAAMGPSEPESLVSDAGTIEATSYQLLDEPE